MRRSHDRESLFALFTSAIKPELNFLYTEKPSIRHGEHLDGWFCREHAYHVYLLSLLLGVPAKICRGDFIVNFQDSSTSGANHAWCCVDGVTPVDLSMTFVHFKGGAPTDAQLEGPVLGASQNGKFRIFSVGSSAELQQLAKKSSGDHWIAYWQKEEIGLTLDQLLANPYAFFFAGDGHNWRAIYGQDIFAKITVHLYKLALGRVPPLHATTDPETAMRDINRRYSDPVEKIQNLLAQDKLPY